MKKPPNLGSVNPYFYSKIYYGSGKKRNFFIYNGTTKNMVEEALKVGLKEGDVLEDRDSYKDYVEYYRLKRTELIYWVEKIKKD